MIITLQIFALDLVSTQYKKTHQADVFNLQPSIHKQGVHGENTQSPSGWKSQILSFSKSGHAGSSKTSSQTCVRPRRAGGWWGRRYSTDHLSSTSPLDTHHLESPSEPDTDDTFSGQGISRMDLIHHPALTDKNPLAENTTAWAAGEKRFNSQDSRRTISL